MDNKEKLVLALDVPSYEQAENLVAELKDYVGVFKVGKELFTSCGPKIFEMIKKYNGKIFADLKFHDIPNTVANAARVMTSYGVDIIDLHSFGGLEMIAMARETIEEESIRLGIQRPKLLAVTILTSLTQQDLERFMIKEDMNTYIKHLARLAHEGGADGVVCSPKEISLIKEDIGSDFLTLTPGIRPTWSQKDDQKRVMTPKEAVSLGTDYIVVGRPIIKSENRIEAAKKILEEINN